MKTAEDAGFTMPLMDDSTQPASPSPAEANGPNFGQEDPKPASLRIPMAVGGAVVIGAILLLIIFGRSSGQPSGNTADPYIQKVQLTKLHMLQAENLIGGNVIYLEGEVTNTGDKNLNGATVQVIFRNGLNEAAQQERLPLMIVTSRQPYTDTTSIANAPLKPGQTKEFQLTLEHVTADWNGTLPEVTVRSVATK